MQDQMRKKMEYFNNKARELDLPLINETLSPIAFIRARPTLTRWWSRFSSICWRKETSEGPGGFSSPDYRPSAGLRTLGTGGPSAFPEDPAEKQTGPDHDS